MPSPSGVELRNLILKDRPRTPVLLLSGDTAFSRVPADVHTLPPGSVAIVGRMAPTSTTTRLAQESVHAFLSDNRNHHQPRHRISPPPAQYRIQEQAAQENCRQIGAKSGLPGIGAHGPATNSGSNPALRSRQQRHGSHGHSSHDDASDARFRRCVSNQSGDGFVRDVQRQRREAGPDDSQCGPLDFFTPGRVQIVMEPPEQSRTRSHFNRAVQAKPD